MKETWVLALVQLLTHCCNRRAFLYLTPKIPSSPHISVKFSESRNPAAQPNPQSLLEGGVPESEAGIQEGRRGPRQEPGLPRRALLPSPSLSQQRGGRFDLEGTLPWGDVRSHCLCLCACTALCGHMCMHDMLVTYTHVCI